MNYGELQEFFKDFQWIDNIPEDQVARDKICLEAKAALLIEANRDSERFTAFIRNSKKSHNDKSYQLSDKIYFEDINYDNYTLSLTCNSLNFITKSRMGNPGDRKLLPLQRKNILIVKFYIFPTIVLKS